MKQAVRTKISDIYMDIYMELGRVYLGSTAQLRPWSSPQNPAEFLGGFSTIFFFTG
jgi:hypothetical protein